MDTDDESECSPPPCLTTCLQSFGNMISPGDGDFDQVCRIISAPPADTTFSSLYCCDLNCGRKFGVAAGHDRTLASFIYRCSTLTRNSTENVNKIISVCKRQV